MSYDAVCGQSSNLWDTGAVDMWTKSIVLLYCCADYTAVLLAVIAILVSFWGLRV